MTRSRVLIVAFHFPPDTAVGSLRTLRLVRHLTERGWTVTVLAGSADQVHEAGFDRDLLARVPAGCRVLRPRVLGRRSLAAKRENDGRTTHSPVQAGRRVGGPVGRVSVRAVIGALCSIPDRHIGWWLPACVKGWAVSRTAAPDVIYSSAPPWTGHLVAGTLAALLRRPWVADFRDPWARAPWRNARLFGFQKAAAHVLESVVIRRVDAAVFATEATRRDFARQYGAHAQRFHVVPNGCDPGDFRGISPQCDTRRFVLTHAGSLYGGRNPLPLLRAIATLIRWGAIDPACFRVRFVGAVSLSGMDLRAAIHNLALDGVVDIVPPMSRRGSLAEIVSASALLVLQPGTDLSIPAKLYEYLAASRPILALTDGPEIAELVRASGRGRTVSPFDETAIGSALLALLQQDNAVAAPVAPGLYDGRLRATQLGDVLEGVIRCARAPAVCLAERPPRTAPGTEPTGQG